MTHTSILVVTRNYPPLTGGMERLMKHTVETLAGDFDVVLIGPAGSGRHCSPEVRVIECPVGPIMFLITALVRGLAHCIRSNYSVVLGGSGLVSPVTYLLGKLCRAQTMLFVHGLDLVVDSVIYQRFFIPFVRRHDLIVANSRNTLEIAVAKGCEPAQLRILHPGSHIPDQDVLAATVPIREELELGSGGVVLFVGRIIERKGLTPFLERAWPRILAADPDITLLVVGDTPDDALAHSPNEARKFATVLDATREGSVRFLGGVNDDLLWRCYATADVLVFPLIRTEGDVEGFGMVAIEAAACGTPTVAFPVGGVADAVADGISGRLVPEGDYDAFGDAVLASVRGEPPSPDHCRAHALNFSWDNHSRQLLSMIRAAEKS